MCFDSESKSDMKSCPLSFKRALVKVHESGILFKIWGVERGEVMEASLEIQVKVHDIPFTTELVK